MNRRTAIALTVFAVLIILSFVFPQSVYSQDSTRQPAERVIIERPMVNGKQQLMELRIRRSDHCVIYRIEIDNVFYIANTCGGIVVEPKND